MSCDLGKMTKRLENELHQLNITNIAGLFIFFKIIP